jgi:acetyl-CoA C-acetyltransferase
MRSRTPVLIGAGQFTFRGGAEDAPSPLALLLAATERAAADAGLAPGALRDLDTVAVTGFTIDAHGLRRIEAPRLANPPASLARRLGARPRREIYSFDGGNTPQALINHLCAQIAAGESRFALAAGAEFLGSLMKRLERGLPFPAGYGEEAETAPERFGSDRAGTSAQERAHGLDRPVNAYPLFENALRARDGRDLEAHMVRLGRLFAAFSQVAAANPDAWFRTARSVEELITVTETNRMIGYPYPKLMNAIIRVDQSAGVLIASEEAALEMGVSEERFVRLHGCADAADLWDLLERQNYHSSPAIRMTGAKAFEMAGLAPGDVDLIDLYSCFPCAVEIAAEELGLGLDDPRGLTVTGGLPFMGGPGNNYAMHAVAVTLQRLRERKARSGQDAFGLVTANGWYLTKQSVGLYSTLPLKGPFVREDPRRLQAEIDALPHPEIVAAPEGEARVETYTVCHDREGYRMGIVIGRDAQDRRFVAKTPADPSLLRDLESREGVGRWGRVSRSEDGRLNIFRPH